VGGCVVVGLVMEGCVLGVGGLVAIEIR